MAGANSFSPPRPRGDVQTFFIRSSALLQNSLARSIRTSPPLATARIRTSVDVD